MSDYAKKNVEHFDKRAASYDSPLKVALAKKCTDAFLQAEGVTWDGNSTKVIDFACGTGSPDSKAVLISGLISLNLLLSAKEIIGLDTSYGMVEVYNQKAVKEGVAEKMKGRVIDVLGLREEEVPADLKEADVVVCSMAFHHIEDIGHTSRVLASLLKKGGHLFVVDLMQSEFATGSV
jgi:2-polyprenyl-3-methyl-5-hydroxy-6-metoxy-1,4-benzoquinol methylase